MSWREGEGGPCYYCKEPLGDMSKHVLPDGHDRWVWIHIECWSGFKYWQEEARKDNE